MKRKKLLKLFIATIMIIIASLLIKKYYQDYQQLNQKVNEYEKQIKKYEEIKDCKKVKEELNYLWKHYSINENILKKSFQLIPNKKIHKKINKPTCLN